MSNNDNGSQRRNVATGASVFMGAVGIIAGLAAAEHAQAREENRESIIDGLGRWFRQTVSDLSGVSTSNRQQSYGLMRSTPSPLQRALTRPEVDLLPVRRIADENDQSIVDSASPQHPSSDTDVQVQTAHLHAENPVDHLHHLKSENPSCVICREFYAPGDLLMRLPCFHEFHGECIRDYLETAQGPLCPICRYPVTVS